MLEEGGVHAGERARRDSRRGLVPRPAGEGGQQKISSPSAGTSDAGPSPDGQRPLFFFFFSFLSFGFANPNRRVEEEGGAGAWLGPSGPLLGWLAELSM